MITKRDMYGKENKPFGYYITYGKKYPVTVVHRRIAPDTLLESRFLFTDDNGEQIDMRSLIVGSCLLEKNKWRELQLNEIGIV